jgi:hypothetical protein
LKFKNGNKNLKIEISETLIQDLPDGRTLVVDGQKSVLFELTSGFYIFHFHEETLFR